MKIGQLCAVDFTLYHFLLPLMRGLAANGHEAVGITSDGTLLAKVRQAGFRVETVPLARSYNPVRHVRAIAALVALLRRERFDVLHVHTPVAALIGRLAAAVAGVPRARRGRGRVVRSDSAGRGRGCRVPAAVAVGSFGPILRAAVGGAACPPRSGQPLRFLRAAVRAARLLR